MIKNYFTKLGLHLLLSFGQINLYSKRIFVQELEIYSIEIFERHFRFYFSLKVMLTVKICYVNIFYPLH